MILFSENPLSINVLGASGLDVKWFGLNEHGFNGVVDSCVPMLVRGSLAMLIAMLVVRLLRPRSMLCRRLTCVGVLMHGWLLAPWTIEIPWYDPPADIAGLEPMHESLSVPVPTISVETTVAAGDERLTPHRHANTSSEAGCSRGVAANVGGGGRSQGA
ncbi:hypothetical protein [Neorhodopirellula pilleata]|uniref:Uncharacterized protein n=1 Tax=Neorhodopirellula pilleata TaxID=2714738 RepID=A0A5C6AHN7_9BACT|nr:hypothetical protein [Neorhodopirellula pilleata]TWT98705.1 hypothetical protein Pla100_18700 [Neorhodopirellula pilleata]